MMLSMKAMTEHGALYGSEKAAPLEVPFCDGAAPFFPSFIAKKKAHKDKPCMSEKRTTKLK